MTSLKSSIVRVNPIPNIVEANAGVIRLVNDEKMRGEFHPRSEALRTQTGNNDVVDSRNVATESILVVSIISDFDKDSDPQ